ncbi:MAG TPA: alpha/beta fold hydrolase [Anaerolineales bacterium]|nr:alpha/beta fold hydrolase [Anaerolineales bacterium]
MEIDLELYRYSVPVSVTSQVRLSVIDIAPEHPQRTMVFIHGYGGKAMQWAYQLQEFSIKNRVIAFDLRGHGLSDKPPGRYTMDEIQADLINALDWMGVGVGERPSEKIVIVGHSFGGAVVTEFTHRHPERVDRMILIASAGEYRLTGAGALALRLPFPILRLIEPFTKKWLHAPARVLKPWFDNNLTKWNGWSMMRDITTPTLVIRGNRDRVFDAKLFEEVARALPNAEEVDVGVSAHMVMLERRDAVNRAIKRFIEESADGKHPPAIWSASSVSEDEAARAELIRVRPWLKNYENEIPYTVAIPNISVFEFLQSASRRFPRRTAIYFEGRKISYLQLDQESNRFANALCKLGISHGERVMLLLPNIPQMVICFFGALKAGSVPVFTLPNTPPAELVRKVIDSGTEILVTIPQFAEAAHHARSLAGTDTGGPLAHVIYTSVAEYLPRLKQIGIQMDGNRRVEHSLPQLEPGTHALQTLLKPQSKGAPDIRLAPTDLAAIVYTGGTTADPKGVMLCHRNLVANTLQTRHWLPDAEEGRERFLCVIPFSHIYGLTTALNVPIGLGATLILKARFEVEEILETIKRERPTIFPGVPQMYVSISNFPGVRKYNVSSINACISGSAPLAVETQEQFEKLTRGRLVEGYGLTEAAPVTHANPLNGLRKVGSIGIPIPSTEAKILDLARRKREVQPGQIGELAVRGPQIMMGYWQNPDATKEVLTEDGWLLTGDVAQMDSDGYFRIVARKADMWYPDPPDGKSQAPAFPRDVEEVLHEVPQVKEAAVVAIAGQPIAFIITKNDKRPPAADLIAYCKRRLPPEIVPRLVIFMEDFPRTFIGKVLRRELAKRYEEQSSNS